MRTKIQELQRQLIELSELEDSFFKSRAYKNASLALNEMTDEESTKEKLLLIFLESGILLIIKQKNSSIMV